MARNLFWITIMGPVRHKASGSGDLLFKFHMECLILTQTKSKNGAQNTASARLDVWIELEDSDGTDVVVRVSPADDGSNDITGFVLEGVDFGDDPGEGRVTMCGRAQSLKNDDPENFVELWLVTRQAHGFVWGIADPAKIVDFDNEFDVRVKAVLTNTAKADTTAKLAVAKRSLVFVEGKIFVGAECQDGADNDGDGNVDLADTECETATDTLESE